MSKLIQFIANRYGVSGSDSVAPSPILKFMPQWFREADRFVKDPSTGDNWIGPDGGKMPTWKACPALFDIMTTGYSLLTPCDLEFFINDNNQIDVKVPEDKYRIFCSQRQEMPQFENPHGYYKTHFAWFPEWGIKLPNGYSALYSSPFNRFDLPFITVSGIIDNDKVNFSGTMPFFIKEGWTGVIPAGTPYAQIIPFKREDWHSEHVVGDANSIMMGNIENSKKYRVPNGGVYKNQIWSKRSYK